MWPVLELLRVERELNSALQRDVAGLLGDGLLVIQGRRGNLLAFTDVHLFVESTLGAFPQVDVYVLLIVQPGHLRFSPKTSSPNKTKGVTGGRVAGNAFSISRGLFATKKLSASNSILYLYYHASCEKSNGIV